jgi:hypothetical protein
MLSPQSLFFIAILASCNSLFAQQTNWKLMVPDSMIQKLHIKEAVQWSNGNVDVIERYGPNSRITQRIVFNDPLWKSVTTFQFKGKRVIEKRVFNNYKYNRNCRCSKDTVVTVSKEVYRPGRKEKKEIEDTLSYDSLGRLSMRTVTGKCNVARVYYTYGVNGKVSALRDYDSNHNSAPKLKFMDSFEYNESGILKRQISYSFYEEHEGIVQSHHQEETNYTYSDSGLLTEKIIVSIWPFNKDNVPYKTHYSYAYAFYQ